jgi:predicted permease
VLIGLLSGLRSSRVDVERFMRDSGHALQVLPGRQSLRSLLVVAQIAACVVLLSAAGLLTRSLARAERTDLGFRPDGVLNIQMDVGQLGYDERRGRAFFDDIDVRVAKIPGVQDLSFAFTVPLGYISVRDTVQAEGQPIATADRPMVRKNMVGSRYFTTMGIPLVRGRTFGVDDNERTRPVAIVNERLAEMLWPGQDALGRRFSSSGPDGPWIEVVGVTRTGKYRTLFEDPLPYFYVPIAQNYTGLRVLHVRTSVAPEALATVVERIIQAREPDLPLYDVQSMTAALGGGYGLFLVRAAAFAATMFGVLGLALAAVGIFGLVSYLVGQRTREIGIRMALGASGPDILRLVLRDGAVLMALGLAMGFVMALASGRFLAAFLFGVSPADPLTFAGVAPILVAVAAAACAVPAWQALRVNPATTLRSN